MTAPRTRPARTKAHAERDALLQQFADAGLQPIISTNGSIPHADIELTMASLKEGGQYGEMQNAAITERGAARLRWDEVPEVVAETLTERGTRLATLQVNARATVVR